jgi:hypothetical protein
MASPYPPRQPEQRPQGPYPPTTALPTQPFSGTPYGAPTGYPQGPTPQPVGQSPAAKPPAITRKAWAVIGVGAVLVVILLGVLAVYAPGSTPTTSTASETRAAAEAATTQSAPAPTTKAALPPPTGAQATRAWYDEGGAVRLGTLAADVGVFQHAAGRVDVRGIRSACGLMQSDVKAAQALKPIPDEKAQAAWATALALYARAATDCLANVDTFPPDLMTRINQEISDGGASLGRVTVRIQELSR